MLGTSIALAMGLTACTDAANPDKTADFQPGNLLPQPALALPQVTEDPELAVLVPEDVRHDGTLVVATAATYPPMSMRLDDTWEGVDANLAQAVAALLGLKLEVVNTSFDQVRQEVDVGEADLAWSYLTITNTRLQQQDFVSYYRAGQAWLVKSGSTLQPDALCGHKVAIIRGFTYEAQMAAVSDACKAAGDVPVKVTQVVDALEATELVANGKVDAAPLDSPVVSTIVSLSGGSLQQAGQVVQDAPLGVAVRKDSPLSAVVSQALQRLIDTGVYEQILQRWRVPKGAIAVARVNPEVTERTIKTDLEHPQ